MYLQIFTSKINKNIEYSKICKYSKFMNDSIDPEHKKKAEIKKEQANQFSESGLYVREDDQDWGSSGMNDVQNQSDIS